MRFLTFLLVPAALVAGQARYARLGEFEGTVEVQLTAADSWMPAERNLPLVESAWLRTSAASRVEIELDEGSAWRLGPESQGELSDYTRLSTGQRISLFSLDRGIGYFTGEPKGKDALSLAVPGAQLVFLRRARVRLEAAETFSRIAVIEGTVRFSSPAAEIDLHEGQTVRVEPSNPSRFFLDREVAAMKLDEWSEQRDKAAAGSPSAGHVLGRYGLVDLDTGGEWLQTDDLGAVWKPRQEEGWYPFQQGRWRWYDALGYTWVSDDPWGWLPYHYGRWQRKEKLGWVWAPSVSTVFKPGDVYWLRGPKFAAWGPLAPGEIFAPPERPDQFYQINTSYAAFLPDARAIDPADFGAPPKDPLAVGGFVAALPSPAFVTSRLDAVRPVLRAGSTRVAPVLNGVTYQDEVAPPPPAEPRPVRPARAVPPVVIVTPPAETPEPEVVAVPVPVLAPYLVTPPAAQGGSSSKPAAALASAPTTSRSNRHTPSETPRVEPTPAKKFKTSGESELYNAVLRDTNDPARQIQDLDTWSNRYPHSDFADDRRYLYLQAYARVKPAQPSKVLEHGAPLIARDVNTIFQDPQQVLVVRYLVTVNAAMPSAVKNSDQLKAGIRAAQELLESLPTYFAADRRPPTVSETEWRKSRSEMEAVARKTLALTGPVAGIQAR